MTETDLKERFMDGVRSIGWWMEKFPDTARASRKPFDLLGSAKGRSIAVEAKLTDLYRMKPAEIIDLDRVVKLSEFRRHQIPNLLRHQESEGRSLALIGIHLTQRRAFRSTHTRAWLVPVDWIVTREEWFVKDLDPRCELLWAPGVGWRPKDALCAYCEGMYGLEARDGSMLNALR